MEDGVPKSKELGLLTSENHGDVVRKRVRMRLGLRMATADAQVYREDVKSQP